MTSNAAINSALSYFGGKSESDWRNVEIDPVKTLGGRSEQRPWTDDDQAELLERKDQGWSRVEVAISMDRPSSTIGQHWGHGNLKPRPHVKL